MRIRVVLERIVYGNLPALAGAVGELTVLLLVRTVPAWREPDHSANLLFNVAFISEFGDHFPDEAGVYRLLGESYELARVVFVTFGQRQKKFFAADFSAVHEHGISLLANYGGQHWI